MEVKRAAKLSSTIGVLVADSNKTRSQLLVSALRRRSEFEVTGCGMDSEAILAAVQDHRIQVAIMNVGPGGNPWDDMTNVRRLHLAHPEIAKVILMNEFDREIVVQAFRSGVRGLFCFATSPFRHLCRCIHRVHDGQIWANSEQLNCLLDTITHVPGLRVVNAKGIKLLTPREEQVVALVADGLSNRETAVELALSEHTVKKYLLRIFDKLGISTRVELVLYAVCHGHSQQAEWVAGGLQQ
jgi:two-component system nitrate/nitrite response regulator NarL